MELDFPSIKMSASVKANYALANLIKIVNAEYANSYPANLFKNKTKCLEVSSDIDRLESGQDSKSGPITGQSHRMKDEDQNIGVGNTKSIVKKEKAVIKKGKLISEK